MTHTHLPCVSTYILCHCRNTRTISSFYKFRFLHKHLLLPASKHFHSIINQNTFLLPSNLLTYSPSPN